MGGMCPHCGMPLGGMSGMMAPGMGPQDAAMLALGDPMAGVRVPAGMPMQDPMASLTPEQAGALLQFLQYQAAGQPAPQAMGPGPY